MGFNCSGLGPADQQILTNLQPTIIGTLRGAAMKIQQGGGRAESKKWFGDDSNQWMSELGAEVVDAGQHDQCQPIDVHFSKLQKRCGGDCGGKNAVGWLAGFHRWAETDEPGRRSEFPHHSQFELESIATLSPFKRPADSNLYDHGA